MAASLCVGAGNAADEGWRADLAALETGLARNYANFEQQITDRRIDLTQLALAAEASLSRAPDDATRRMAFEKLIKDLRDPHVRIEWPGNGATAEVSAACPGDLAETERAGGLRWERLAGFVPLDDRASQVFRAGLFTGAGGQKIGVLRIGLFMERAFAEPCAAIAQSLGMAADAACDDACGQHLDPAIGQRLDEDIAATLDALRVAGATQIVLDISGNHGGSDWVEPVVRILGGPVHAARVSMVKHPAWQKELEARIADMEANRMGASAERLSELDRAIGEGRAAVEELKTTCDLSVAWTDSAYALQGKFLPCTNLVSGHLFSTGFMDTAPAGNDNNPLLFIAGRYGAYRIGATKLPIVILVDGDTHSAAELLAAALQDAGRATLVGSVTPGAGCGQFTSDGTQFTLPVSGGIVHVPDCVRLRADGSSERRGITPDILVPWGPSDSAVIRVEKAAKAIAALQQAP